MCWMAVKRVDLFLMTFDCMVKQERPDLSWVIKVKASPSWALEDAAQENLK